MLGALAAASFAIAQQNATRPSLPLPALWYDVTHALGRKPIARFGCLTEVAPRAHGVCGLVSRIRAEAASPLPQPARAVRRPHRRSPAHCPAGSDENADGERMSPRSLVNIWGQEFLPAMREWVFYSPHARRLHSPRHRIFVVSGGSRAEYRDIVVPNHQGTAFRLGYNYSFTFDRAPLSGFSVYWNKVAILLEEMDRSPAGSYCVWIDDDMVILPSDALEAVIDENPSASVIVSKDSYERAFVNTGTLIVRNDPMGREVLHQMIRVGQDRKYAHKGMLLAQCTQQHGCFSEQDALRAVIRSRLVPQHTIAVVPQRLINTFARPQRHFSGGQIVRNNDARDVVWGVGSPMGQCTGLEPGRVRETCIHTLLDVAAEVTAAADEKGEVILYGSGAAAVHAWWTTGVSNRLYSRQRMPWERLFKGSSDVAAKVRNVPDRVEQKPSVRRWTWSAMPLRTTEQRRLRCSRLRAAHRLRALYKTTASAPTEGRAGPAPWGFGLTEEDTVSLVWGDAQECLDDDVFGLADGWASWPATRPPPPRPPRARPTFGDEPFLVVVPRSNQTRQEPPRRRANATAPRVSRSIPFGRRGSVL